MTDAGARIETVIVFTQRLEDAVAFYRAGLGLREPDCAQPDHVGFQLGPVYFGFDRIAEVEPAPGGTTTVWFTVDDLEETYVRFLRLGARPESPPADKPWGARLAAIRDLEGNLVGLAARRQ
jgi:catechol 2,3-dioxygenase-like lactoylglutathione lyase family enzyme